MSHISYTLPCHKREADLMAALPSVIEAAGMTSGVDIVVVDYGSTLSCRGAITTRGGVYVTTVAVAADHFHMAHARNVGIRTAKGDIVVAFLADQMVSPPFFADVRAALRPGTFLKWQETFAFWREDIIAAGGFDERFEFYGPEGKELADRLKRCGLKERPFPVSCGVSQLRTPNAEKVKNYRLKLSKQAMHERGMAIWRENQAKGLLVANEGHEWGAIEVPCLS